MTNTNIEQISNRIRYESVSKLANEIGIAISLEDVNNALKKNIKYIVSSYRYISIFKTENEIIDFCYIPSIDLNRNQLKDIFLTSIERPTLFNKDSKTQDFITSKLFLNDVNKSIVKVCRKNNQTGFVFYLSSREDIQYNVTDFKFIQLIGEILLPKIQSIVYSEKLNTQHKELKKAYGIIQETSKELNSSIDYATMIQKALLPSQESVKSIFKKNFIIFRPRDKVSGDFYFSYEANGYKTIIAADCTGHGVPGAILSIFGIQILREICKAITDLRPDLLLTQLDSSFQEYLSLGVSKNEKVTMSDGMDIAIATASYQTNKLLFSSASRPLDFYSNEKSSIERIKGSRFPIGSNSYHKSKVFELNEIPFKKGDRFYIYSDGYPDQFGGENNKKFGSRRLKELLLNIQTKPITKHHQLISNSFLEWKADEEQIDDVLLIGIEL